MNVITKFCDFLEACLCSKSVPSACFSEKEILTRMENRLNIVCCIVAIELLAKGFGAITAIIYNLLLFLLY